MNKNKNIFFFLLIYLSSEKPNSRRRLKVILDNLINDEYIHKSNIQNILLKY